MDFRGLVFKRVWKRTIFALNLIGLWFGEPGGTPPPRIPRSTPRAPPVGLPQPIGAQRKPITLSEQIPCTRVTAISLTSLCLEWIWCEFRLSFRSHKPVSRRTDLKMVYFLAFKDVYFSSFSCLILSQMRSIIDGEELPFFAEKEYSNVWQRSYMGVAHFGSWVRNAQLYLKRYCKAKNF